MRLLLKNITLSPIQRQTKYLPFSLAIHCVWDNWVIGTCSAECGPGTRTNTRVKLVEESNGGTCTGKDEEVLECMDKECPGTSLLKM